ncbi:hypothetical protein HBH61_170260 [Parastagonospora nodorum]|nr:hypothetical protein HBH61_170260 [Parastagonospora nodorum]KAH4987123.1 hypothetical protein HBI76_102620 [Parastagonospora nodorum]KAH5438312.1 hypothetical protein HBI32_013610 [Parastagonospora nodorum]
MPHHSVTILYKDFHQIVAQDARSRHDFTAQPERRKRLAKARNWLWSASLRPHHSWVYWQDVDVEKVPATIFEDLMKHDSDVVVPSVWMTHPKFGDFPYDLNSWIESDQGRAVSGALAEDTVIVEGYPEFETNRTYLARLRRDGGDPMEQVEIDAVGGVSILAKSEVFRAGCHFPAFSFQNQVETEAFGQMAKAMGFHVRGLPHYTVWHAYEEGL